MAGLCEGGYERLGSLKPVREMFKAAVDLKCSSTPPTVMRSVIRFFNVRNIKPADIHRQLCEVYGDDAISDGMVRKWVRKFNEGRISVHDEQIPVGHL
ncbi:hypothetical protein ANN_24337 [Periplaneta americana]|uniref:Mos1 transposase HTH domain-containing protein n=1 Tax=Periplaneta americana TaxID=6978 RepID=A0ABQ8S2U0_PERAM|nr:hypothetical protein ANN_24337 [Periplaneta americana]